jgi:hypothetical protein
MQLWSCEILMIRIGTVINYCTLEYRFIGCCINAVLPFSSQIVLVAADRLFDGTPENRELLNKTYEEACHIDIVEYTWRENDPIFLHNMSRWTGLQNLRDDIEFVLFLDADEIVDQNFIECLLIFEELILRYDAFLCRCYWYFRETKYRAKTWELAGLLVRKNKLTKKNMFTPKERNGIVDSARPNVLLLSYIDGTPVVHHYSWVRTKEEMLKKVKSWGHRDNINWEKLIEEEFAHEFLGTDFLPGHHYEYETIEPVHDIRL